MTVKMRLLYGTDKGKREFLLRAFENFEVVNRNLELRRVTSDPYQTASGVVAWASLGVKFNVVYERARFAI